MQPFDKHQANTGELEQCGASLLGTIGQSIANGHTTDGAYRPAIGNWTGMCAPEIAAAPGPFHQGAAQTRAALAWAAVVTRYWASQVTAFNARVDAIVSDLNAQGPHYGATGSNGDPPSQSAALFEPRAEPCLELICD